MRAGNSMAGAVTVIPIACGARSASMLAGLGRHDISQKSKAGTSTRAKGLAAWQHVYIHLFLGVVSGALLLSGCGNKNVTASAAAPPNVQVVAVIQRDVPVYHEWVATLDGFVNAQIQPQVSGYLIEQNYQEGALVHKNQVLFKIDPRPFEAVLDQAKAQLARAEQHLGKTALDVQRDTPPARQEAMTQT